jgi:pimeloyl-ACP methyl ester carboxylesterase
MRPEKIGSLVLLAPSYLQGAPSAETPHPAMGITTRQNFEANWDSQVGCADQYDPAIRDSIWSQSIEPDSVAAGWGPGVYRWPTGGTRDFVLRWGELAVKIRAPTLLISGENDQTVLPETVRALYADLQTPKKAFAALPCSAHQAAWETRHLTLFRASAEWFLSGTVNGEDHGVLRLDD